MNKEHTDDSSRWVGVLSRVLPGLMSPAPGFFKRAADPFDSPAGVFSGANWNHEKHGRHETGDEEQ